MALDLPPAVQRTRGHAAARGSLPLAHTPLFDGVDARLTAALDARLRVVEWPARASAQAALDHDDHLIVMRRGLVGLIDRVAGGHSVTSVLLEPGAVYASFGEAGAPAAVALVASAASALPGGLVRRLMVDHPRVGVNLTELLVERAVMLRETIALVSEVRIEDRLRARLHQLGRRHGVATPVGVRVRLDLTHTQWATLVGASRAAVTRAFGHLIEHGEVVRDGRSLTVPWDAFPEG